MRRFPAVLAAIVLTMLPLAGATVTAAGPASPGSDDDDTPAVTISGSIAGGIKAAEAFEPITFVFSERSRSRHAQYEDIILTRLVSNHLTDSTCVLANGHLINTDSRINGPKAAEAEGLPTLSACEPGELHRGDVASLVVNTEVDHSGDHISARACLFDEETGKRGECLTLFVKLL